MHTTASVTNKGNKYWKVGEYPFPFDLILCKEKNSLVFSWHITFAFEQLSQVKYPK